MVLVLGCLPGAADAAPIRAAALKAVIITCSRSAPLRVIVPSSSGLVRLTATLVGHINRESGADPGHHSSGHDYEVFLVPHPERYERRHNTAVARAGVERSHHHVRPAIMTIVFASFVMTGVPAIKEIGWAWRSAIAIAHITRLVLCPHHAALASELVAAGLARPPPAAHAHDAPRRVGPGGGD